MSFNRKRKLKKNVHMFLEQYDIGSVVRSRTGRSRGRLFVVVSLYKEMKDTLNKLNISLGEEVDVEVPFAPDPVE